MDNFYKQPRLANMQIEERAEFEENDESWSENGVRMTEQEAGEMRNTAGPKTTMDADQEYEQTREEESDDQMNNTQIVQMPGGVSTEKRMFHAQQPRKQQMMESQQAKQAQEGPTDSPLLKKSGLLENKNNGERISKSMIGALPPQVANRVNVRQHRPLQPGNFNWDDTNEEKLTDRQKFLAGNSGLSYSAMTNEKEDQEPISLRSKQKLKPEVSPHDRFIVFRSANNKSKNSKVNEIKEQDQLENDGNIVYAKPFQPIKNTPIIGHAQHLKASANFISSRKAVGIGSFRQQQVGNKDESKSQSKLSVKQFHNDHGGVRPYIPQTEKITKFKAASSHQIIQDPKPAVANLISAPRRQIRTGAGFPIQEEKALIAEPLNTNTTSQESFEKIENMIRQTEPQSQAQEMQFKPNQAQDFSGMNQRYKEKKSNTQFSSDFANNNFQHVIDETTPINQPNKRFSAGVSGEQTPEGFEQADNAYYQKQMQDQINMLLKMHNNLVEQNKDLMAGAQAQSNAPLASGNSMPNLQPSSQPISNLERYDEYEAMRQSIPTPPYRAQHQKVNQSQQGALPRSKHGSGLVGSKGPQSHSVSPPQFKKQTQSSILPDISKPGQQKSSRNHDQNTSKTQIPTAYKQSKLIKANELLDKRYHVIASADRQQSPVKQLYQEIQNTGKVAHKKNNFSDVVIPEKLIDYEYDERKHPFRDPAFRIGGEPPAHGRISANRIPSSYGDYNQAEEQQDSYSQRQNPLFDNYGDGQMKQKQFIKLGYEPIEPEPMVEMTPQFIVKQSSEEEIEAQIPSFQKKLQPNRQQTPLRKIKNKGENNEKVVSSLGVRPNRVQYSIKDFQAIKQKDERNKPSRSLGPNIGSDEWSVAQRKLKASKDYAKDLRENNKHKFAIQSSKMESMMAGGFGGQKFVAKGKEGPSVKDRIKDYAPNIPKPKQKQKEDPKRFQELNQIAKLPGAHVVPPTYNKGWQPQNRLSQKFHVSPSYDMERGESWSQPAKQFNQMQPQYNDSYDINEVEQKRMMYLGEVAKIKKQIQQQAYV